MNQKFDALGLVAKVRLLRRGTANLVEVNSFSEAELKKLLRENEPDEFCRAVLFSDDAWLFSGRLQGVKSTRQVRRSDVASFWRVWITA
jgi:hypothetical protein